MCVRFLLSNTNIDSIQYNKDHTCTHTTSHCPLVFFDIRDCGSSSAPNDHHDMFLCFSTPPPPFLVIAGVGKLRSLHFFAVPKEQQLLVVFCHLSFLSLWSRDTRQWLIHCECVFLWPSQKKGSSVMRQWLDTSALPGFLLNIMFYMLKTNHFTQAVSLSFSYFPCSDWVTCQYC